MSPQNISGVSEVNGLAAKPTKLRLTVRTLNLNAATLSLNAPQDSAKIIPFVTLGYQLM